MCLLCSWGQVRKPVCLENKAKLLGLSQIMKDFERNIEEARLVDHRKLTLHFKLNYDSPETCWRLLFGKLGLESLGD